MIKIKYSVIDIDKNSNTMKSGLSLCSYVELFIFQIKLTDYIYLFSCYIPQCMTKMSDLVYVGKLQHEGTTHGFSIHQGNCAHSTDHCKELLHIQSSRQECKSL